jgi:hypothetical protein
MAADQLEFNEVSGSNFINENDNHTYAVKVTKVTGPERFKAYVYRCHLNEDNDGAPKCYGYEYPNHPPQVGLKPLDGLANGVRPKENLFKNNDFEWVGLYALTPTERDNFNRTLVLDPRTELEASRKDYDKKTKKWNLFPKGQGRFPVVKQSGDDRGYYVSTTAQPNLKNKKLWEQERYFDASEIAYAVWANEWANRGTGVVLGDYGLAIRDGTGRNIGFLYADTGTSNKLGECSRKLTRTLYSNPYKNEDFVSFLVFPGSAATQGIGQAGNLINITVRTQIDKLNRIGNANDLLMFLALGSNKSRFDDYLKGNGIDQRVLKSDQAQGRIDVFMTAFRAWGYRPASSGTLPVPEPDNPVGDFPGRKRVTGGEGVG